MVSTAHFIDNRRAWTFGAVGVLLVFATLMIRGGSPFLIIGLLALLLAPAALYAAARYPVVFPYALYVLLIPFDNLLGAGSFGTLTKLLGACCAAALIFWCIRHRTAVKLPPTILPLIAFLGWIAASTFWAIDQQAALDALPTYFGLAVLYLALSIMPLSERQYRFLVYAAFASGVISAGYGAFAFYKDPSLSQLATNVGDRLVLRIANVIIDPNHFAAALILPASITIMLGLRERAITRKRFFAAALCVIAIGVDLSGSRGGLMALAVVVVYYLVRSRQRLQVAVLIAALAAVLLSTQSSMWTRLSSALATGGSGRTSIWSVGLDAFKHRWLAGFGIGNFPNAYDTYYIQVFQSYSNGWTSGPHNVLVRYLVETGIAGTLLLVWFFWEHFRSIRFIDRGNPLFDFRIMSEAGLAGLITSAMTLDLFHYKYFWLMLALIVQLRIVAMRSTIAATPRARSQLATT